MFLFFLNNRNLEVDLRKLLDNIILLSHNDSTSNVINQGRKIKTTV